MNRLRYWKQVRERGPLRAAVRATAWVCMAVMAAQAQAQDQPQSRAAATAAQPAIVPASALQAPTRYTSLPAITAGARLAANCAACHGTSGMTDGVALPSLAGQGKGVLLVALKAFKSGARQGTIMPQIAKGYTDEQLAQLAEFFAAQPPVPVAALPPLQDKAAAAEPPPALRVAVTGWTQEHSTFAGYGHVSPILRATGGQP
ncbi:c-type cytochrome [Pseudoduganella rivuli]|nr:c-type cytochrome [Pseudoduganella rivuli]